MLHLHAVVPIAELGIITGDALLVSTSCPGKMARVTLFDGDFAEVALALESGKLGHVGQPLKCQEVEDWVACALGEPAPTPTQQRSA